MHIVVEDANATGEAVGLRAPPQPVHVLEGGGGAGVQLPDADGRAVEAAVQVVVEEAEAVGEAVGLGAPPADEVRPAAEAGGLDSVAEGRGPGRGHPSGAHQQTTVRQGGGG